MTGDVAGLWYKAAMRSPRFGPRPFATASHSFFARVRAKKLWLPPVGSRGVRALLMVAIGMAAFGAGGGLAPTAEAASRPSSRVAWKGKPWLLTGASLPWIEYGCDFGCRQRKGVVANAERVDRLFRRLSRNGVKVVRWHAFPGDAWQVRRAPDGTPVGLRSNSVFPDFDRAVGIAAKHDIYLQFVLFGDPRELPTTWFSVPAQRERLATSLAPLFARYERRRNVLAWELFDEPEPAIDAGAVIAADMQATVARLAAQVHASSNALVTLGAQGVDRLALWNDVGLDYHAPHWWSANGSGPACAGCTSVSTLAASLGVNKPVVIGATDVTRAAAARQRLDQLRDRGYAGALLWNVLGKAHPTNAQAAKARTPLAAPWRFIYEHAAAGPRARVLNPCLGPMSGLLLCPDLRMSAPTNLVAGRQNGRTVLYSRNSLNSMGRGPAEIFARRSGRLTMTGVQKIWRRGGGKLTVDTDAQVYFKAIPGQYRYWKWRNAATFELWRLDGAGTPYRLVRTGPKTVYCLRDLRRTHGYLSGSPRRMFYPGCNQSLGTRRVTLGTSVGWSDIYPSTYHENWIDVSNLRGCFAYVHIADPTDVIYESNEENNRSQVTVRLPFTGSNAGCPRAKKLNTVAESAY